MIVNAINPSCITIIVLLSLISYTRICSFLMLKILENARNPNKKAAPRHVRQLYKLNRAVYNVLHLVIFLS